MRYFCNVLLPSTVIVVIIIIIIIFNPCKNRGWEKIQEIKETEKSLECTLVRVIIRGKPPCNKTVLNR